MAELSTKVTTHFCEDEKTFRLEDCIGMLLSFCEKIKSCQQASACLLFLYGSRRRVAVQGSLPKVVSQSRMNQC